jgi:hypothetical protein
MTNELTMACGEQFVPGMTVVVPEMNSLNYRLVLTDPNAPVNRFVHDGHVYTTPGNTPALRDTDVSFLYSSPAAFYNARAARLRLEVAQRQEELEHVEALAVLGS